MRRQLGAFIVCFMSTLPLIAQSERKIGCRPVPVNVAYELQAMDENYVNTLRTVRILDASPQSSQFKIAIYSSSLRTQWDSRLFEEYVESGDHGHTWHALGSRFSTIVTPEYKYFQAPSDTRVLYQKLDNGRYARSEDGGGTWVMPEFRIVEASAKTLFGRALGTRDYHFDFTLVAIHPTDPLVLYASVEILPWAGRVITSANQFLSGIYFSTNGGETWNLFHEQLVSLGPNYLRSAALAISPSNPAIMYGVLRAGISKTEDGGKTWSLLKQQEDIMKVSRPVSLLTVADQTIHVPFQIQQIAIDPHDDRVLYVVSDKGIFRTLDGGNTWDLLDLGFDRWNNSVDLWIDRSNTDRVLLGTKAGLFESQDRGCHFSRINTPADDLPTILAK